MSTKPTHDPDEEITDVERLKRQRRGKKSSITRRINELERIVSEGGSRTRLKYLLEALLEVYKETKEVSSKILKLTKDDPADVEWIEKVSEKVDGCVSEVHEYLERRKDDPPSTASLTRSWVDKHSIDTQQQFLGDESTSNVEQVYTRDGDAPVLDSNIFTSNTVVDTGGAIPRFTSSGYSNVLYSETSGPPQFTNWREKPISPDVWETSQPLSYTNFPQPSSIPYQSPFNTFHHDSNQFNLLRPSTLSHINFGGDGGGGMFSTRQPPTSVAPLQAMASNFPINSRSAISASFGVNGVQNTHTRMSVGETSRAYVPQQSYLSTNVPSNGVHMNNVAHETLHNHGNRNNPRSNSTRVNYVDSWIDSLDENRPNHVPNLATHSITSDVAMAWLVQQQLPRTELPTFDGSPTGWVEFITKFRDVVHRQGYLNDTQKYLQLQQHLKGEAKRSVTGFSNDAKGYVRSLKRLKYLFGQRSKIAEATLLKVTRGKVIENDDLEGFVEFYYTVSDCLVTLRQLCYESDLYSSDTLRQAVRRLPSGLVNKWAEHSVFIRQKSQEPNLIYFAEWLERRVLARKEAYLPESHLSKSKKPEDETKKHVNLTYTKDVPQCPLCNQKHPFWKCTKYKCLSSTKKYDTVMKLKRCFNCLSDDHILPKCPSRYTCFAPGCSESHHTSLHEHFTDKKDKKGVKFKERDSESENKETRRTLNLSTRLSTGRSTYLQVVPVKLSSSNGQEYLTYAILDDCSQNSLLREDVAEELGLKGETFPLNVTTIKDSERMLVKEVAFTVSSRSGENSFKADAAYVVPKEKFNMPAQPRPPDYRNSDMYTHLDGLELEEVFPEDITVLIGADIPEAHIPTDVRRGTAGQPLVIKTPFDWTLFGVIDDPDIYHRTSLISLLHTATNQDIHSSIEKAWNSDEQLRKLHVNLVHSTPVDKLHQLLEKFWVQEHDIIHPAKDLAMSRQDDEALHKLESDTRYIDDRYEVPMLREDPNVHLPDSSRMARKRFQFLLKRMRADPSLYEKYKSVIDGYLDNGYCRIMDKEEAKVIGPNTWTLPHHPVFNQNKPETLRMVFDAAAEVEGVSLNKTLVTGPDLLKSLIGVIMRLRTGRIAIAADVEAYYHQVRVPSSDADSLRFYWTDDIFSEDEPYTMQMLVHIFGAKDSANCAIHALRQTARDNYSSFDSLTYETMLNSFYMDDLLKSVNDEESMCKLAKELIDMCRRGGFRLTKFLSNSEAVLKSLPPSEISPNASFDIDNEHIERALGILWDTVRDVITFSSTLKETVATKRGILRTTASMFDPMGFLTPFILKAKIILQELWRLGYDWDEAVDETVMPYWKKWLDGVSKVSEIKLDRCYNLSDEPVEEIQLHIFCDASELAYGAVAYLRYSYKTGGHHCSLVVAKSKLAPIKVVTLPRLELNSAVAAVRLFRTVIHEIDLPIEKVHFWTDSELTLQYITNRKKRKRVYVANRTNEINEYTKDEDWHHIPGKVNPADLLTRGVYDPTKLLEANKEGTTWLGGPYCLSLDEEHWPTTKIGELDGNDPEIKQKAVLVALTLLTDDRTIDVERFSSWIKLKRVVTWFLRFVTNCKQRIELRNLDEILSSSELINAEHFIIKDMQRVVLQEELRTLRAGNTLPKRHKLASLCPFIDDEGIIRVGGRLKNAPIPAASKHQIIVPKDHQVTTLIIRHEHNSKGHIGVEHVLANLRESLWIVAGRTAIKTIIRKCFFCQVRRAQMMYPYMADLPEGRVAYEAPPFTNCGVDLFGPLYIKQGRQRLKRWAVLFTCLSVRCVHLEVVEGIGTDPFINTLRRFVNRRGCPSTMYSDGGTNFVGATSELKDVIKGLKHDDIRNFAAGKGINWQFNPPDAPHMGGAWERLVRSVKEVMTGLMKDRVLTDPQLNTLLTEVESILNTRPLTHASDDVNDFEALTPNHILLGKHRHWEYMADNVDDKDVSSRKRWRQVQALAGIFWKRWRREYLPDLNKRAIGRDKVPNIQVNDLVVLNNGDCRRGKWPLGRITRVMPGVDGVVRVVEVKTKDGIYTRPVVKVCKLED